jgi:chromosome segregation ATPase
MNSEIKVEKPSPSYLKRSNNGGLFIGLIYVLVLMSILFLALWQSSEIQEKNASLKIFDDRISVLEEQLNLVDESNMDSMSGISASLQFLDKEVRKLWDLSNKRNKVDINKLKDIDVAINADLKSLDIQMNKTIKLIESQTDALASLKIQFNSLSDGYESLNRLPQDIKSLETQLMLIDDSIRALESYKKQINQTMFEIQTEVTGLKLSYESVLIDDV